MEKEKWVVSAKGADFKAIGKKFGIDPVIARIIRNRDVQGDEAVRQYLYAGLDALNDAKQMKGMQEAISILRETIANKDKIRIIGDYDIDGVMSSYIFLTGLRNCGANVDVRIPHRMIDGYGINEHLVRQAAEDKTSLIVTCDNGIAAKEPVAIAKELGMRVIVTDHHEIPVETDAEGKVKEILPPAETILNPKQRECPYPFKGLCGGGVAFKLIDGLYESLGIPKEKLWELLEYAAFATIGDVMDLVDENRILVREGLKRLRNTENLGLRTLMEENQIEPASLDVYHIGFILGPCFNASGRLETAQHALELLCAKDKKEALRLAHSLIDLNAERKGLTEEGAKSAMELVETTSIGQDRILVVFLEDCHPSIAGIIAGRLKERYHKPSFVLTPAGDIVKGSGRSIEAYDMYEGLCGCKECFAQFGGHKMAAGVSLKKENVELFRKRINETCALTDEDMIPKVVIDVPMPIGYIYRSLIDQFSLLEPFGKGNEKPVFAEANLIIRYPKIFGKFRNVVRMQCENSHGVRMDAVYFGDGDEFVEYINSKETVSAVYYPVINEYQGQETIQLRIQKVK